MEKRKRNSAHLVFIMATLEKFFTEKKQFHPKVHLAVTFSKNTARHMPLAHLP